MCFPDNFNLLKSSRGGLYLWVVHGEKKRPDQKLTKDHNFGKKMNCMH